MNISKTTILVVAFILTVIAIFIFNEAGDPQSTKKAISLPETVKPSSFIQNGRFVIYDKAGYSTILVSEKTSFFENANYADIVSPSLTLEDSSGDEVHLTAQTGRYYPKSEKLTLKGDVIVSQIYPVDSAWSLRGEAFTFDNKSRFISSDQAVNMKKGLHSINAIGLKAWIDEKRIELLSQVRGEYVF